MPCRILIPLVFTTAARGAITGQACNGGPDQLWAYNATTQFLSTAQAGGSCLTATAVPTPQVTTPLAMAVCGSAASLQAFLLLANNTIVLASAPEQCVNLAAYGTAPGTQIWLADCSTGGCRGNCDWEGKGAASSAWANSESGLCIDDGQEPPAPYTCAAGSPSENRSFCNYALPFAARVADFLAGIDVGAKLALWGGLNPPLPYDAAANVKSFRWDQTCIHGIGSGPSPSRPVSVFPHALSLGSTWDVDLVARIGAATALEGRAYNQLLYRETGGTTWQGVSCDGGPLANTAHDPRWGRISETYGEDPVLASAVGVAHLLALQNRSAPTPTGDYFVATGQVTRHFLGFHEANDLPGGGVETIAAQWLYDQQLPVFRAFQVDGRAEGIMMSMNAMDGVPSVVNPLLYAKLAEWGSSCLVQTDCCDSLSTAVDELHYFPTMQDAVVGAMGAGLDGLFTVDPARGTAALASAVAAGLVDAAMLDRAVGRLLLHRFRLGEFDTGNPANPFRGPWDEAKLDGPEHRALAREAAAASVVLLHNAGGMLPLRLDGKTLAVLGPFAACAALDDSADAADASRCSYMHSYSAATSAVSTVLAAAAEEVAAASGARLLNATGSGITQALAPAQLAAAVAAAAAADFTLLVLGTGNLVEEEGLDRSTLLLPPPQQALLAAVSASASPSRLIVAVVSAGGVDLGTDDVSQLAAAYLVAGYGGEETGHGLLDVLVGRVSPSGRLPLTHYAEPYLAAVAPISDFNMVGGAAGGTANRTYRFLQGDGGAAFVRFPFGAGLSYARFAYSGLNATLQPDGSLTVAFAVANTGGADAHEVVQCYVRVPAVPGLATPGYALKAFARVWLQAAAPAPTPLLLSVPAELLQTTLADGSRTTTPGAYAVYVSGHLPSDASGGTQNNGLTATVEVSAGRGRGGA